MANMFSPVILRFLYVCSDLCESRVRMFYSISAIYLVVNNLPAIIYFLTVYSIT